MSSLPILDIKTFKEDQKIENAFYSNNLSTHLELHHNAITNPHKHNFYLSVLFTEGKGTHEIDFHTYPVTKGSLFLLTPGQTHSWELSEDVEGYIFFHNKAFYDLHYSINKLKNFPFYFSLQNSRCIHLLGESFSQIESLYKEILVEHQSNEVLKDQKLKSLIDLTYIELSRLYVKNHDHTIIKNSTYASQLNQFEQLIEEHYLTIKSPAMYAEIMNITTKHLNRISKIMLDKTSSCLITDRVILEAKRMLINLPDTASQISFELGYDDHSYFSRLFKKKCSETPIEFQKRYL